MPRKKAKDELLFNWTEVSHIVYIASLYPKPRQVYDYLKASGRKGELKNLTYHAIYTLVEGSLGLIWPA